ncbi:MAG: putative lipid II flippase MurJ [Candidatus Sericytochromatia bacterium]|nr:MAG: putative lipid II flippase MurJ [Candidatus Sericytochromatia bacterium]
MGILKAASLIAFISLISKIFGLFREQFISAYYGTSYIRDAYSIASLLPSSFALIMLAGLNGPFHSAIVSVITKYKTNNDNTSVKIVVSSVTLLSVIFMSFIVLLCFTFPKQIISFIASKNIPEQTLNLAIIQFKIMAPIFVVSAIIGILYGICNIEKIYITPSLSPVMASLSVIIFLLLSNDNNRIIALAWGTLVGALLQLFLQLIPLIKKLSNYYTFNFNFKHQGVYQTFSIILPASLSSIVGQINIIITTYFASGLPIGSISALTYANFIYQLPLGILLTSLLVPMLPILNQTITYNDNMKSFKININKSIRMLSLLSIPSSIMLFSSGEIFIKILLERGAFDYNSRLITYISLACYTIGLIFYAFRDLFVRVFYALDNAKIPFYTSFTSILIMYLLCYYFVTYLNFEIIGISLAVSFVTIFNCLILYFILIKKIGNFIEDKTIKHFIKVLISFIPLSLFCTIFNYYFDYKFDYVNFIIYCFCVLVMLFISFFILILFKDEEIVIITNKIKFKLTKSF